MTTQPCIYMFIGYPGSGKTHFARQLSSRIHAVTLNSDALRVAMFGSLEKIERIRASDQSRLYNDVFGAMDYTARQTLRAGHSVIYDAQQTKRVNRRNIERLAREVNAIPVLIWMKTSPEVAMRRGAEREAGDDSHVYSPEKMTMLVNRFASVTDLPESDENVIEISGELPFEEQFLLLEAGLREISRE